MLTESLTPAAARLREVARRAVGQPGRVGGAGGGTMANILRGSVGSTVYGSTPNRSLYHRYEQYGMFQGSPFSVIRLIANRLAMPQIQVALKAPKGKRLGKAAPRFAKNALPPDLSHLAERLRPLDDHPILDVLADPNPLMLPYHLKLVTWMGIEVFGEYYWWMERGDEAQEGTGARPQIWPVPPHWVQDVYDANGQRRFGLVKIQPPGAYQGVVVPARQMVPFRYPDIFDPFAILSPLQAMARSVSIDAAGELAVEANLRNGANPGLAIITGRPAEFMGMTGLGEQQVALSADQRDEFMTWFRERYQGFAKSGEPLILDGIIKDVKQLNGALAAIDNSTLAAYIEGRIYKGFAVNRVSMGDIEAANRASAAVADDHLVVNALEPRTTMINQTLTKYLGRYFADERGPAQVFQCVSRVRDDDLVLAKQVALLDRQAMTPNEARAEWNLEPTEGGDEMLEPAAPAAGPGDPSGGDAAGRDQDGRFGFLNRDDDDGDANDDRDTRGNSGRRPRKMLGPSNPSRVKPTEAGWRIFCKRQARRAQQVRNEIERSVRRPLRAFLREKFEHARKVFSAATRTSTVKGLLAAAWPEQQLQEELVKLILPVCERAVIAGVDFEWQQYRASKSAKLQVKDAAADAIVLEGLYRGAKAFAKRAAQGIGRVVTRVWNWLKGRFKKITDAIVGDRGDAVPPPAAGGAGAENSDPAGADPAPAKAIIEDAAHTIAEHLVTPQEADQRADDKAGGDATTIFNHGRHAVISAMRRAGKIARETWKTRRDRRVRESHVAADAQERGADGRFVVGGHRCEYPGDPSLPAGERINCRCITVVQYR